VNVEKLTKQIRREVAANPKKAALLGLMFLVALYFWGPLLTKWIAPSGEKKEKASITSLILTDDPVETASRNKTSSRVKFRWEKARQLIEQDPRMASATFDPTWSNPFGGSAPTISQQQQVLETQPTESSAQEREEEFKPSDFGLVLSSVMMVGKQRLATINGDVYRQGDSIAVGSKDDKATAVQFKVARILLREVELERNGRRFGLQLVQPKLAGSDEMQFGKASTSR
jgi:hypothetical protein